MFYRPYHLVEYYRYMRFFMDGTAVVHTSADEPLIAIPRLKLKHGGGNPSVSVGHYRLSGDKVCSSVAAAAAAAVVVVDYTLLERVTFDTNKTDWCRCSNSGLVIIHYLDNPIIHLYHPPPPKKKKQKKNKTKTKTKTKKKPLHNYCLQFLLGHENVPREVENNAYADFWGVKEVYYGIISCK